LAVRDLHTKKESQYVNQYFFEIGYDIDFINNISTGVAEELEFYRTKIDESMKLDSKIASLYNFAIIKLIEEFHLGIYNFYIKF